MKLVKYIPAKFDVNLNFYLALGVDATKQELKFISWEQVDKKKLIFKSFFDVILHISLNITSKFFFFTSTQREQNK